MHQLNIYHGHLIDDDHISLQRILLIALKAAGDSGIIWRTIDLQQTVNRPRLPAGSLGHTFGRATGGGRQGDAHFL